MINLNYKSIATKGAAVNGVHTYNTIEEAKVDMMLAIFSEGCSVIDPVVTDSTGKQYKVSIAITEA